MGLPFSERDGGVWEYSQSPAQGMESKRPSGVVEWPKTYQKMTTGSAATAGTLRGAGKAKTPTGVVERPAKFRKIAATQTPNLGARRGVLGLQQEPSTGHGTTKAAEDGHNPGRISEMGSEVAGRIVADSSIGRRNSSSAHPATRRRKRRT